MEDSINVRQIRKFLDLTQDMLAEKLGVSKNTIWNWENDKTPIPSDKASVLLTMMNSINNNGKDEQSVMLLPINAIGGYTNDDDVSVMEYECERIMSPIRGAELAVRVSGDSMYPRYPNGSMVFIRKHDPNIFIEWGSYYVVNTTNGTIIKRITDGDDNTITCSSVNPNFKDFKVARSEIRAMYKILGCFNPE